MRTHVFIKPILLIMLALQLPADALACRIGHDQHLFEESPPAHALAGAQIVRVRFSNARPAIEGWPRYEADPRGGSLSYTLIGVARRLSEGQPAGDLFPVYALVTSCSYFWSMHFDGPRDLVEGDFYLIGRFASDAPGAGFYAGGRRVHHGRDVFGGWHF